jgi:hypothetical protein
VRITEEPQSYFMPQKSFHVFTEVYWVCDTMKARWSIATFRRKEMCRKKIKKFLSKNKEVVKFRGETSLSRFSVKKKMGYFLTSHFQS